jgi:hypothetical protein
MRILIANRRLTGRTGTEIVTRDLALAVRSLGHEVDVYSPVPGPVARELSAAGVRVYDDLACVAEPPDVLHGNHPKPLLDALRRFPGVPAVSVCHDFTSARDEPVCHPRILRYVAVDDRCRRRIERQSAIPRERIMVHLNAVDLARFRKRPPLPARPVRALVFSNYASWHTHLPVVRATCRVASLPLDVIGLRACAPAARPEAILGRYDLVFAKARCALEAMAVGAAVVLCDAAGLGPMVTSCDFDRLRRMNFGQGLLTRPLAVEGIATELARYDARDAAVVSERVRSEASLERAAARWCDTYREVVDEARHAVAMPAEEDKALALLADRLRDEARMERAEWRARRWSAVPRVGARLESLAARLGYRWSS